MLPFGLHRVTKPKLVVGGFGDAQAQLNNLVGFVRLNSKAKIRCVHNHKAVSPKGGINLEVTQAGHVEGDIDLSCKAGEVFHRHLCHLAAGALGYNRHQAARGL